MCDTPILDLLYLCGSRDLGEPHGRQVNGLSLQLVLRNFVLFCFLCCLYLLRWPVGGRARPWPCRRSVAAVEKRRAPCPDSALTFYYF